MNRNAFPSMPAHIAAPRSVSAARARNAGEGAR